MGQTPSAPRLQFFRKSIQNHEHHDPRPDLPRLFKHHCLQCPSNSFFPFAFFLFAFPFSHVRSRSQDPKSPCRRTTRPAGARILKERSQIVTHVRKGSIRHPGHRQGQARSYPKTSSLPSSPHPNTSVAAAKKLEGILEHLKLDLNLPRALDIGASTGGFTDCMLQKGVSQVVCLDVGRNQLHHKILSDPRVTNIEKYNARHLQAADLPFPDFPLLVTDVSFISLKLILPPAWPVLQPGGHFICLVKPQFEADKKTMDQCKGS